MGRHPVGLAHRAQLVAAAALAVACLAAAGASRQPEPPPPTPTLTSVPSPIVAPPPAGEADAARTVVPEAPALAPFGPVIWSELHYSAHKLIFGASTTLRVETLPAARLAAVLRRPPKARPVPPPGGDAVALSATTTLPFGRDEWVTLWLDPATGAALGGEKTVTGGSSYHKLLRFTDGGLYTWRSAPSSALEEKLGPEGWTLRKQYLAHPTVSPPEGTPVTDAYALLYIASAARLDRKDGSLQIVMRADDGYVELAFASGGLSRVRVGFDESWPAGSRHRDGDVLVRSVRVTGHGLDATQPQDDVDLGFLGMRGALTIFVELGSGIPVAFSGRAEHVGNLTVRLDRAVLSDPPPPDPEP